MQLLLWLRLYLQVLCYLGVNNKQMLKTFTSFRKLLGTFASFCNNLFYFACAIGFSYALCRCFHRLSVDEKGSDVCYSVSR